jgi:FkbM family methyltransferase
MTSLESTINTLLQHCDPDNPDIVLAFNEYRKLVDKFGFTPVIKRGTTELFGWDIEYVCGAALPNFVDSITIRRLNDFIADNDCPHILDCGANIGFSSLSYKKKYPKASIIAFEPDPTFLPVLKRNLFHNGAVDVEIVDAAVWTENSTSYWYIEGVDGSHLGDGNLDPSKRTTVKTIDLCEYLNRPVDLLKLDIEGSEYQVINHIKKYLANVKSLSIECHVTQNSISDFGKMIVTLKDEGFHVNIGTYGHWQDLTRYHPVKPDHFENYILVSARRHADIKVDTHYSWIPSSGVGPIMDFVNHLDYFNSIITAEKEEEQRNLLRLMSNLEEALTRHISSLEKALTMYAKKDQRGLKKFKLAKPFIHEGGKSWSVYLKQFKHLADNQDNPHRSTLFLFENGELLRSGHSVHADILNIGDGRYSHWDEYLYFSTSDGSNPNINGYQYSILYHE